MLPAGETEFDGQAKQAPDPRPALYWLVLHCEQLLPFSPVYPALHMQWSRDRVELPMHSHAFFVMLPAGEKVFSGQSVQAAGPSSALYWLILHCEHGPPFSPVYPALHSQAVIVMLPATHSVQSPFGPVHPALQPHAVTPVLPCNEARSNGQSTQAKVPGIDLYLPGAHITQGPPSEPVDSELQIHCVMTVLFAGEVDCNGQAIQAADIP